MSFRIDPDAFIWVFLLASYAACTGCGGAKNDLDSVESNASAVEMKDKDSKIQAVDKNEKIARSQNAGIDAASILGEATKDFANTFSDGETVEKDEPRSIDMSLVDDETKRKYSDDRTQITPTLDARDDETGEKFKLEYRFEPNTNLSWQVVHLVRKTVSYGGKETLTQTSSTTYRRWELLNAVDEGKVAARHWIDRMILEQNQEGKDPIRYDSEKDVVVPKEIAAFGTEKAVGVALENFDLNMLGVMSDKTKLVAEYQGLEGDSNVVVPFPKEEVAVGDVWTIPYSLYLKGADKVTRPYHVVERFRLESIDDKYASISFKTTLVSIVDDPVVEGELAERLFSGSALFDRKLGLTVRTEMTFNKKVTGAFGFSSYLDYNCQVVEKLIRDKEAPKKEDGSGAESAETLNE